jgi:hypothetical protein
VVGKRHAISDNSLARHHDRPTSRDLNGSNRGIDGSAASIVLLVDRCRLIARGPHSEELDEESEDSEDTAAGSVRVLFSLGLGRTYKAKKVKA